MAAQVATPPIFHLPNELIVEIAAAGQNDWLPQKWKAEWTLSHVCRRFRHAVLGASILWTQVKVDLSHDPSVQLSQLYFERSALCRIRLTLLAGGLRNIAKAPSLRCFISYISRISHLAIARGSSESKAVNAILDSFRDVPAPCLEHLEIESGCETIDLSPLGSSKIISFQLTGGSLRSPLPQWMGTLTHLGLRSVRFLLPEDSTLLLTVKTQLPSLAHLYYDTSAIPHCVLYGGFASKSLTHIYLEFDSDRLRIDRFFLQALPRFDTPHLRHLSIRCASRRPVLNLFNIPNYMHTARPSFPALTSLAFTNYLRQCSCGAQGSDSWRVEEKDWDDPGYRQSTSPPLHLFPVLSSLAVVNQCFTARFLSDLLGSHSPPWPLLKTVTVCPPQKHVEDVYATLQQIVRWKHGRQEALPTFRLSANLFERKFWEENGVHVELS